MHLRGAIAAALAAASIVAVVAPVGAAPELSVTDPAGDANYLNSQYLVTRRGDVAGPVDASAAADILALWFTHNDRSVTAHIKTEAVPGESDPAYLYRVQIDPGTGTNCVWLQAISPGDANPAGPFGRLQDTCSAGSEWEVTKGVRVGFEPGRGGTGHVTITVPRKMHLLFERGGDLIDPHASVRNFHYDQMYAPQIDDTAWGATYHLPPPN